MVDAGQARLEAVARLQLTDEKHTGHARWLVPRTGQIHIWFSRGMGRSVDNILGDGVLENTRKVGVTTKLQQQAVCKRRSRWADRRRVERAGVVGVGQITAKDGAWKLRRRPAY